MKLLYTFNVVQAENALLIEQKDLTGRMSPRYWNVPPYMTPGQMMDSIMTTQKLDGAVPLPGDIPAAAPRTPRTPPKAARHTGAGNDWEEDHNGKHF